MTNYSLTFQDVTKTFGRRLIFKNINQNLTSGNIYGFSGRNGSGKSTLVKIAAGIISPTKGKVIHQNENKEIIPEKLHNKMGFVSPYLFLYNEFTAEENLIHISKIRGLKYNSENAEFLLNEFNLYDRKNDYLKGFSSGMLQRMKFIFALLHSPNILFFDEPTSNLDTAGKDKVYEIIENEGKKNLVIVATNEESDLALCSEILEIEKFKN
ncbi:MAG: ABC transporter ATP-binding protein [Ignavibacteriales bacterium]|nr:ABC transporter ATP-binding protein [Ignavibacteriales bacterium]MCB9210308.1 ABC transporter ATP-binding protein [Ignavibacteriales bacterium]MCB9259695.1 ABC transporter ATP-binding protein [Ignavibacteriales bacterium]